MLNRLPQLRQIGYWRESRIAALFDRRPHPTECVDEAWSKAEREKVVTYLRSRGRVHEASFGYSECRICGVQNGCHDMTDGTYVWPSGYAHYIEHHEVRPPAAFVAHVFGT